MHHSSLQYTRYTISTDLISHSRKAQAHAMPHGSRAQSNTPSCSSCMHSLTPCHAAATPSPTLHHSAANHCLIGGAKQQARLLQVCIVVLHSALHAAHLELFFSGRQLHALATATQCSLDQHWEAHSQALLAHPAPRRYDTYLQTLHQQSCASEGFSGMVAIGLHRRTSIWLSVAQSCLSFLTSVTPSWLHWASKARNLTVDLALLHMMHGG